MRVSTRRVQQILKEYIDTGTEPSLGENLGRSAKLYDEHEAQIVKEAHERYRFGGMDSWSQPGGPRLFCLTKAEGLVGLQNAFPLLSERRTHLLIRDNGC